MSVLKRRLRDAMLPGLFAALCAYFAWHSVHGDLGLNARELRLAEIGQAQAILRQATNERDAMQRRVSGLRGETLDRDQLDERARTLLNLVGKDEIVIPYGQGQRLY